MVLPYIEMNPPQVYMCSPSWTLLPPPSPFHPSGSSQCTSPKHPVLCIEPGLATRFIQTMLHVSMPFSQAESRASPGLTQECVRSRNAKDLSSEAILHLLAYFGSLKTGLSGPLIGLFCGWFIPPTGSWISLSCIKVGRQCVTTGCSDHQLELMVVVVYSLSCIWLLQSHGL